MNKLSFYIRVRYGDTDKMGVVYHTQFINYFEIARTEYFRTSGLTYKELEDSHGIMLPVIDLDCSYKSPAFYDDLLEIRTWLDEIPRGAKIKFHYEIYRESIEKPIVMGNTTLAFVEIASKKVIRCPEFVSKILTFFST